MGAILSKLRAKIMSNKPSSRQKRTAPVDLDTASSGLEPTQSSPGLPADRQRAHHLKDLSASEGNLSARRSGSPPGLLRPAPAHSGDMAPCPRDAARELAGQRLVSRREPRGIVAKKPRSYSPADADEDPAAGHVRDILGDIRRSARIVKDSRLRLQTLQKKETMTEADVKELCERNELLLREMERFSTLTRSVQRLVTSHAHHGAAAHARKEDPSEYIPGTVYEPAVHHEMKMNHPSVVLAEGFPRPVGDPQIRSKSEVDLSRKLSESYDMQERLVADNADLEVKRYILYKELMTKDQNLETCRAQVKRLQGELKLMSKENILLQDKLNVHNPQAMGDALNVKEEDNPCQPEPDDCAVNEIHVDTCKADQLADKLEDYKNSSKDFEKQFQWLKEELDLVREEMASTKGAGNACRGGAGQNKCFEQSPGGPPVPPMTRACGVCPPCPAPCNPDGPPTPAEKEVQKLNLRLRQTEESFKTKVAECAMLRVDLMGRKEELEKERCQHREAQTRLRELEMKFEGLATHTNMMLGTKEQALEQELGVRALKQCYREARDELDEVRALLRDQGDQLQDYRLKYLQAQQLVEEQRRQMDLLDMDNTRISEQINLEIQRVKLKFQEKLQELAPIPALLKATQTRLKDAQQSQALAEHNAEQLARELNVAREKVHMMLHAAAKPPKDERVERGDDKQLALAQQRIAQLIEANAALKAEIERLKANVIRMEEGVLANEKRLAEKMHECAQLGGELDRARDEAARALQRATERTETIRKCMQTTVAELERQLAAARAQVRSAEKEREEVQCRMNCQIQRLNENFEQAQLRVLGLQTQVQTLRRTASSTGEGDSEPSQECACKSFFNEL